MLQTLLQRQGHCVGRRRIRTLMQRMCMKALYCKPRTSARQPQHKVLPVPAAPQAFDPLQSSVGHGHHLCAHAQRLGVSVCRGGLVQPQGAGLGAVQHHGCAVLCGALQEAIAHWGTPAIFNTDQGSQFTSDAFTGQLKRHGIRISMDGKGAWRDNVFVECLWRSIKYEEIYLKAYDSVRAARCSIAQYLQFKNSQRPHQAHNRVPPDEAYFAALPFAQMQEA